MAIDINRAYSQLVNALEQFHAQVMEYQDPDAAGVLRATDQLADAYTVYDDAIFTNFGIEAPFDTYDDGDADYDEDSEFDVDDADAIDDDDDAEEDFDLFDDEEYDDDFDADDAIDDDDDA